MVRGHFHKLKVKKEKNSIRAKLDSLVMFVAAFGILLTIPQFLGVWIDKNVSGVSIISWTAYALMAGFWVFYGIAHNDKGIIISNAIFTILDVFIVVGILLYS